MLDVIGQIAFGAGLAVLAGLAAMLFAGFLALRLARGIAATAGQLAALFVGQLLLGVFWR